MNSEARRVAAPEALSALVKYAIGLDHVAIAVQDLEESLSFYTDILGFEVKERRETRGQRTGMLSAVLTAGPVTVVLLQGTSPDSQVSRFIEHHGPGVQHVAIEVRNLREVAERLEQSGVEFDTQVIRGSGLLQTFTHRDEGSGMMFEFIEHTETGGDFSDDSVQQLFEQLEDKEAF